ncbi:MAG: ribonuclease H-like domain-containing protein [Clostridia bacterium]|nr:ribonuclease H-like domain-containing protein [Clostridia bacterium]
MASLRDKLRAAAPQKARPVKPQAQDCYLKEIRIPIEKFDLPRLISGDALAFMQGGEYPDCRREDFLFLDTETTGLSHGAGTVAFLVGVGYFTEQHFIVRQYMMRDYDEEEFLLSYVAKDLYQCKVICTFNGATFDLPLLENRYTLKRMREQYIRRPHVDLLPTARRVWKLRLKKCNLASLEAAVLGLEREDDLPGSMVPERYFTYLKTKEFFLLDDILEHNEQDIISLAHILSRLLCLHAAPIDAGNPEDIFSLGRVYERRGRQEGARMCYRAADCGAVSAMARARMADSFRREGDYSEAARVYERMIACRQGGIAPYIAMAKICEHKKRDIPAAIEYTRKAIILSADQPDCNMADLQKRYQRLLKKARRET